MARCRNQISKLFKFIVHLADKITENVKEQNFKTFQVYSSLKMLKCEKCGGIIFQNFSSL